MPSVQQLAIIVQRDVEGRIGGQLEVDLGKACGLCQEPDVIDHDVVFEYVEFTHDRLGVPTAGMGWPRLGKCRDSTAAKNSMKFSEDLGRIGNVMKRRTADNAVNRLGGQIDAPSVKWQELRWPNGAAKNRQLLQEVSSDVKRRLSADHRNRHT